MGWSIGYDTNWKRDIGYGVPAKCDHPGCDADIDRGLAYVCGGEAYGGDLGCGLYFCEKHRHYGPAGFDDDNPLARGAELCQHCHAKDDQEFTPTPDVPEWITHKLTDESWAKFRSQNPEWVAEHSK